MSAQHGPACHTGGVRSYGNPDEGVMLLGIAPERNEMREGRPFIGESGRLLDAILDAVGWSRDKVYCTNLYCQWNDAPTKEQIAGCAPRLRAELREHKPKILMPLGKIATETVFTDGHLFGKVSGGVFWMENILDSGHSCYVIPTFHPAAILYGMTMYVHDVFRDLRRIAHVLKWEPGAPHTKVEYEIARSRLHAQAFINSLHQRTPYVSIDIESSGGKDEDEAFDPHSEKLLCVGISDGTHTMVIPDEFCHDLTWPLELNWTMHFSQFDRQGIQKLLGVRLPIAHDTLLMNYACDERTGVHALKPILREQLGVGFYEEEVMRQAKMFKHDWSKIDTAVLYPYNAKDAAYTARAAPLLYEQMRADDQLDVYHNIMIPVANAFADMQYHGVKVDMKRLNELEKLWYPKWMKMDDELRAHAIELGAPAPFNPNSDKQMKNLVYGILGLKSPTGKVSEKTGVPSLSKEELELLEGAHPIIDEVAALRQLDHVITNYVFVIRDNIKLDGLLHATPKQHGAVTYRTSYIDPPLQTIPNPKYESNKYGELRDVFVPRDAGHVIGEVDFSKAELYWGAHQSGDAVMMADLLSGDFHRRTASDIFNKPLEAVTKWDRTRSKHVTFGIMYGRGARALAKGELKCNIGEAEVFLNRWRWRYKRYVEWTQEVRNIAMTQGELVSFTGRKRRFKLILDGDHEMLNKAVNFPIQSAASDTTLAAMIKLCDSLPAYDSFPIIMIHDSLVFDLSERYLDVTLPLIKRTMEAPQFPGAPSIEVDLSVGSNWGSTHEVDMEKYLVAV